MAKKRTTKNKINSFLYNHIGLKTTLEYVVAIIATVASSAIFAFGITCFVAPNTNLIVPFVTGGASGIAQNLELILNLIVPATTSNQWHLVLYSVFFAGVNIPIAFLAFKGVGVRFGFFTLANVLLVSLFSYLFKLEPINSQLIKLVVYISENAGGFISRAIFGGVCTGISSAIAFKIETSTGGIDVVSYYLSNKKSTTVGKYNTIINLGIASLYTILCLIQTHGNDWEVYAACFLYSVIYMLVAMLLVDLINTRNKKVQLQIITKSETLSEYLLANVPHGATIVKGKGAFSGEDRIVIYMVVQSVELKKVLSLIKDIAPDSFVGVTSLQQVYGQFFIRPIR